MLHGRGTTRARAALGTLALALVVSVTAHAQQLPPDYDVWSEVKGNLRNLCASEGATLDQGGVERGGTVWWPVAEGSHELGASTQQGPFTLSQAAFHVLKHGAYEGGGVFEVDGHAMLLASPKDCTSECTVGAFAAP